MKISCGIIPFRKNKNDELEFFLGHPGGNYKNCRNLWMFLKGAIEDNESWEDTALREFKEETGLTMDGCDSRMLIPLGSVQQNPHKVTVAFGLHYPNIDPDECVSNIADDGITPEIDKYKWNWKKVDYSAYLFILPVMVFFLSFVLYPMLKGIHLSLYRFRGRHISFVGFKHYINLFQNDIFLKSAWNTVFITFVALPIVVVFSIFVAYVIYEKNAVVRSFFRGIFYIPAISSVVSITVVWNWIYHPKFGILNYVFQKMHVISGPVDWLGNPKTAIFAIIAILITTSVGQPIILYVAALGNVPKDLIEASEIDGANKWQAFKNVTWPLIMPTTLYIVVVTTINSFQIFALIQLLTHGGPNYTTSTVMYLVYQTAISEGRFGVSSAMGIILAIIIGIISILQFKFLSKDID